MSAPLPPDLQKVLDSIDASDRAGAELAARLTDEDFHWKPDAGQRWSVAECLDHLATINAVYLAAARTGIEKARKNGWTRRGPLQPGFFGRKFIASMEPPVKRKLRTPQLGEPKPQRRRDEIMRDYHAAHEEIRKMIREAATIDANRATFRNPFIRIVNVKVATAFHVVAAHDRRHIWQAEQVEREIRAAANR